jgi:hypothetical protein
MSEAIYTVSLDRVANQPVSEGMHIFVITEAEEGESSKGNPMWTIRLSCLSEGADEGKEATLWLPLTDNMRWKLEKFFDATKAPTTGTVTARQFVGRKLKAQISHRKDDNGQLRADVGEMFPFTGGSTNPSSVTTSRVKTAAAAPVVRTGAAAQAKVPATKPSKPTAKGLPADVGEDIPFETQ